MLDVVAFVDFNSLVALQFSNSMILRTICANEAALARRLHFQITISFGSVTLQEESGAVATVELAQGCNQSIAEVLHGASTAIGFHLVSCATFTFHPRGSCRLAVAKIPALKHAEGLVVPQDFADITSLTAQFVSLKRLTLTHITDFPDAVFLRHLAAIRLERLELTRSRTNTIVPLLSPDEQSLMSYVLDCERTGKSTTIILGDGFFLRECFAVRLINEIVKGQQGISAEFKTGRHLEMNTASYRRQNMNGFTRFVSNTSAVSVDVGPSFPFQVVISSDVQIR